MPIIRRQGGSGNTGSTGDANARIDALLQQLAVAHVYVPDLQPFSVATSSVYLSNSALIPTFNRLTDRDFSTGWGSNGTANEWVEIDFGSPKTVGGIEVSGGNLAGWGSVASYVNGRVLQRSNDRSNWTNVLTFSGVSDTAFSRFIFPGEVAGRYWRIFSASGYASIANWQFLTRIVV